MRANIEEATTYRDLIRLTDFMPFAGLSDGGTRIPTGV